MSYSSTRRMSDIVESDEMSQSKKIRSEAHDWLITMEGPVVSDTDRKRFERWLEADPRHAEFYDRAITIRAAVSSLRFDDIDEDLQAGYQFYPAHTRIPATQRPFLANKLALSLGSVFAASILLAVFLLPISTDEKTTPSLPTAAASYKTTIGEMKEIELPDGSRTFLDSQTELQITFSADSRRVNLRSGAAFFEVAKDTQRPFSVEAGSLSAVALGTKFDIRTSSEVYRVGVAEGEVEVRYPLTIGGREISIITKKALRPGQEVAATRHGGLGEVEQVPMGDIAAWRSNRLIYRGATIAEFVSDLNRRSTFTIALDTSDSFSDLKINGAFVGQDVDRLLIALTEMHPVEVDRSDSTVVRIRRR